MKEDNTPELISEEEIKTYGLNAGKTALEAITGDIPSEMELIQIVKSAPNDIPNLVNFIKIEKLIRGLYPEGISLEERTRMSAKLFGEDVKDRQENAIRLFTIVNRMDSLIKIDYLISAGQALSNGMITREEYYRIATAILNTLNEDLEYLKIHATTPNTLSGCTAVHALVRVGAMISAGVDGEKEAEEQDYYITEFGRMIDRYALSYDDEDREKEYKRLKVENKKVRDGAIQLEYFDDTETLGINNKS